MSDQHDSAGDEQQANGDTDTADSNSSERDDSSRQAQGNRQIEQAYPDVGYQTAQWDMLKPPDERVMALTYTNRLKLSEMTVRSDKEQTQYSLFDSQGNTYTQRDFDTLPDSPTPDRLDDVRTRIESGDVKTRRLALAELADLAVASPSDSVSAAELLIELLDDAAPAVQGEALGILATLSDEHPDAVRPAVEPVISLFSNDVHPLLRNETLQFLASFAEHDPERLTEAVPQLAASLHDDAIDPDQVARILLSIAQSEPDALLPVVPKLELYLETEPQSAHKWVLGAVGYLSKAHPGIAEELIPIAAELIESEDTVLRANAAGVLADLADEYPTEVKPIVPEAIELLQDDEEQVRYNASSILARVANAHPDAVEPAMEHLLAVLDDELADTRFNACWALKRIDATAAIEKLSEIVATDPDEDVRDVAQMAIDSIKE